MKIGGILLLFSFLNAYYVAAIKPIYYQKMTNLGVQCNKYKDKYICSESEDKAQIKRFVHFAKQNGIKADIYNLLSKDLINVYSIQIASSKNLHSIEKLFSKYKSFPYARIEKIGSYYTLRVGAASNKNSLKPLLKQCRGGFLRKADIKLNRIIKANFLFRKFNISTKNLEGNVKSSKNYKKACDVYTILSIVKDNLRYKKLRNEACYKYHISNFKKVYNEFNKIEELESALKYKYSIKNLIELNYLKAKNFQNVDINFINSLDINKLKDKEYAKYLKTLLFAGEIKKIEEVCSLKKINTCSDIYLFLNKMKTNDKDILRLLKNIKKIENALKRNDYLVANEEISSLRNINPHSEFSYFYFALFNKDNLNKNALLKYKHFANLVSSFRKEQYISEVRKCLEENNLKCARDKVVTLINSYPNDFNIYLLAGDVYEKSKSYLANFYYHKAYLLNKKSFFLHLLQTKNYKRLNNYLKELKNYPYILSKVYLHKANKLYNSKNYKDALIFAKKSYDVFPSMQSSLLLGELYFKLGDYKMCVKYLKGFNDERVFYYLGVSYYKLGNKKKANYYFNKLSKNKEFKSKLIKVYLEMGERKRVKELIDSI